jgi:photosystem II stability/assembly factor-like uncharacterized protein
LPDNASIIYAGTYNGPYRSDDGGESWHRFDNDLPIASILMIIAQSARDPARVYCGARRGQVFGTDDEDASWRAVALPAGVAGVYVLACN